MSLTDAAANGDINTIKKLLSKGVDVNTLADDGMTALSLASFWGYADIVSELLKHNAEVNIRKRGTNWTPLHCASFQGHGPVVMSLLRHGADPMARDSEGRTPSDFASAIDAIWPLFAAVGCIKTTNAELIQKKIIIKDTKPSGPTASRMGSSIPSRFARPGTSYVLDTDQLHKFRGGATTDSFLAAMSGDVLANLPH